MIKSKDDILCSFRSRPDRSKQIFGVQDFKELTLVYPDFQVYSFPEISKRAVFDVDNYARSIAPVV
jgi:hypothetical protein